MKKRLPPVGALQLARAGEVPDFVQLPEVHRARDMAETSFQCRTLIGLLWCTGCRISEALGLQMDDIDPRLQTVTLRTLKRGKKKIYRVLWMDPKYFADLMSWCHGNHGPGRVFKWRRSAASYSVTRALVDAGVERKRAHCHALRHGHAIHAMSNGVPLNVIQRTMGHSSVFTTSIYLTVTAKDVRREYERIDW